MQPRLTPNIISTIKATAPALAEHGEAITTEFYARLFESHPEVKPLFNDDNQTSGIQQKRLAAAILAYARNIDRLDQLDTALAKIADTHVKVSVKPDHYPIVGECLLNAISTVLGDAVDDDVITAWGTAYDILAEILIEEETRRQRDDATTTGA